MNQWESVKVTLKNPCAQANYTFSPDNSPAENIEIEILSGYSYSTIELPFTNNVNEQILELYESDDYDWPICGYPTHYSLVDEQENDLDFECSKIEAEYIEDPFGQTGDDGEIL